MAELTIWHRRRATRQEIACLRGSAERATALLDHRRRLVAITDDCSGAILYSAVDLDDLRELLDAVPLEAGDIDRLPPAMEIKRKRSVTVGASWLGIRVRIGPLNVHIEPGRKAPK